MVLHVVHRSSGFQVGFKPLEEKWQIIAGYETVYRSV